MTFPTDPLDMLVEMSIGDAWVDITADVYVRDGITITRGRRDEGSRVDPGACTLTLNNRLGKYSSRNPMSPYYGLIGRNTPIRVSVPGTESYLKVDGGPSNYVSTPSTAALNTVDLDVRLEVSADWWRSTDQQVLIGKYNPEAGGERSWHLRLGGDGFVRLLWYTDGGANAWEAFSAPPLQMPERGAFRVTMDSDDGAGGHVTSFYWATSLDGPWTLINTFASAGLLPVHPTTAPLRIAGGYALSSGVRRPGFDGLGHHFELRDGIDGPVIASPDFRSLAPGTGPFTDSAGLEWTLHGTAAVRDRADRFVGEVSSWPVRWDTSGNDRYVPIQAAGIRRRLGQGAKPLQSTLRRLIPTGGGQAVPRAYWPMEEGQHATQAYSPLERVTPLRTSGLSFGADDSLFGSDALPTVGQKASISGTPGPGPSLGGWTVDMSYRLEQLPSTPETIMRVQLGGGPASLAETTISTAGVTVTTYDHLGNVLAFITFDDPDALVAFAGPWNRLQMFSAVSGGSTYVSAHWRNVVTGLRWYATTVYAGGPGVLTRISANWGEGLSGMAVGHIGIWGIGGTRSGSVSAPGITYFDDADDGFESETAWTRMRRLSAEEDLPLYLFGGTEVTERCGPQGVQSLVGLLEEAADVDGGLLHEHRRTPALRYRSRSSFYNQTPALTLDYTAEGEVAPPLEPVDDDMDTRNDVTVTRQGGSSARAVLEEGPLSVQAPPDGVGIYDESLTLNLASDAQAEPIAHWRLHLGTWDEARYPTVTVWLHAAPHLIAQALSSDVGDVITIANPPEWLPPGGIELRGEGYTEKLLPYEWEITFNCSPARPWTVGVIPPEDPAEAGPDQPNRVDTDGSELARDVTETDTELLVLATDGPEWTTEAAEAPWDVRLGGEVVRVSAVEPLAHDAFTRTVADGWGTADSGHVWATSGGAASDFDVTGSQGTIVLAATPTTLRFAETPEDLADCEVLVSVAPDQLATGGDFLPGLFMRGTDLTGAAAIYWCNLALTAAGTVGIEVRNTVTVVGTREPTPWTYGAGTRLWLRARADGHRVRARVWPATRAEPGGWHIDRTITSGTIAAGTAGIAVAATATNVNATFSWDSFSIVTPQRFAVARSANGIVKPHSAGADVRLAHPMITAL